MSPRPKNPSGPPRPTTAKRPVLEGMVGAGLMHAAFVAGALVTFQHSFDLTDQTHAVPVDLITIADKTNVQAMAPPQPEPPKVDVPLPDVPVPPEELHPTNVTTAAMSAVAVMAARVWRTVVSLRSGSCPLVADLAPPDCSFERGAARLL